MIYRSIEIVLVWLCAVYAVLPMSLAFLVMYSYATQRFSRTKLFNIIVATFLVFFAAFAGLYPHHEVNPNCCAPSSTETHDG